MNPLLAFIIGASGSSILVIVTALVYRNRTKSETLHLDAESAELLSQAAARLVPMYDIQLKSMEARLSRAEKENESNLIRLTKAEATAQSALSREAVCLARIIDLQTQINELRRQIETPQVTTTTTTAVTSTHAVEDDVASS